MKEEDILLKKIGKEHSFKVPEGYFENLTSEVMDKLPEKEKVAFKVASSDHKPVNNDVVAPEPETEVVSDQMIDFAVEGAMLDDYSLYVYLSDASVE